MSMRRMVGVLLVVLSVGVPVDMFACGDKFLVAGRGNPLQRSKNVRAASVLIYVRPSSAMAAAIKKAKTESLLKGESHRTTEGADAPGTVEQRVERPLRRDSHRERRRG